MTWFVLVPRIICNDGPSKQKCKTIGFGQENHNILHDIVCFTLTFRSRLVLVHCKTCAESSTKYTVIHVNCDNHFLIEFQFHNPVTMFCSHTPLTEAMFQASRQYAKFDSILLLITSICLN